MQRALVKMEKLIRLKTEEIKESVEGMKLSEREEFQMAIDGKLLAKSVQKVVENVAPSSPVVTNNNNQNGGFD